MDRGRAGGFITDNNYFGVKLKKKQRREHLERLIKIMTRKPGSSITLDNNPPVVVKALTEDPRKLAKQDHFNFITEKENRSLLKRISTILIAPPKISPKDYDDMRKLCKSAKDDPRAKFDQALREKRMQIFFEQVKKTGPYYSAKRWEEEYQHQKKNQKFMRQVKYRRPENFKESSFNAPSKHLPPLTRSHSPSASLSSSSSYSSALRSHSKGPTSPASEGAGGSAAHVRRVKERQRRGDREGAEGEREQGNDIDGEEEQCEGEEGEEHGERGESVFMFRRDEGGHREKEREEMRVELASIERQVKISREGDGVGGGLVNTGGVGGGAEGGEEVEYGEGKVFCYLVDNESVVIVAQVSTISGESVQGEAEISMGDLAVIGDFPLSVPIGDSALRDLAQEIVENVEVKLEDGEEPRLLLSLVNEGAGTGEEAGEDEKGGIDGGTYASLSALSSSATTEEVLQLLLPDRPPSVLSVGLRIGVSYLVSNLQNERGLSALSSLSLAARMQNKPEQLHCLVKVKMTEDDMLMASAYVVQSSLQSFKKGTRVRSAVAEGSEVKLTTSLPSLVQADPDLIVSFAENLVRQLRIEHDCKTGENLLVIASGTGGS